MRRRGMLLSAAAVLVASGARADGAAINIALRRMLAGEVDAQRDALRDLAIPSAVPGLIAMLFWLEDPIYPDIVAVLNKVTGASPGSEWFDWMVWQQDHPEYPPHAGFNVLLADLYAGLDPQFSRFLRVGIAHTIRLEEITWGGVKVDGIPALDDPAVLTAAAATYLNPDDVVFGAVIGGQARAWPMRIIAWHEMVNDVLGGVPVSLAYCTLCGSAILYDGRVQGRDQPFRFGSSGLLFRSNKLMYDRETDSLWNQFAGRPVIGALVGSGVQLAPLALVTTTWQAWKAAHPATTVLSLATGVARDYGPGVAYRSYFASPDIAFPAAFTDRRLAAKDKVFGLRLQGGVKAYPLTRFAGGAVINDRVGLQNVVLIGDAAREEVRAYASDGEAFTAAGIGHLTAGGAVWQIEETALRGSNGRTLARLPGHIAYWFAWAGYFPDQF